jgi:hypothetical protein
VKCVKLVMGRIESFAWGSLLARSPGPRPPSQVT